MEKTTTDIIVSATAYISSDFHPSMLPLSGPGEPSRPSFHNSQPRKNKRTKYARNTTNATTISTPPAPNPNKTTRKPDPSAPKITRPCTECGRKFWSWKALFGHMRCHPEREWRGIDPPPGFRRPETGSAAGGAGEVSSSISEEEREVAACLLLLADGLPALNNTASCASDQFLVPEPEYSEDLDLSAVVCSRFECSSCKKVFRSHQALGGHRASHKNVKGCYAITKNSIHGQELEGFCSGDNQIVLSMDTNTNTNNDDDGHKCNICYRVFTSGQALGGHMRCHWEKVEEPISRVFGFDLNLAADDDDVDDDYEVASSSGMALDLR